MARRKGGVNKSEEIRQILKENPKVSASEAIGQLKARGIEASDNLFYFIKGKMKGRRGRRRRARKMVASVAAVTGAAKSDALATINKIKNLAAEVGGMKSLRALVEALST